MEVEIRDAPHDAYEVVVNGERTACYLATNDPVGNPPIYLVWVQLPSVSLSPVNYSSTPEGAQELAYDHAKKYADGLVNIVDNTSRAKASAGDDGGKETNYIPTRKRNDKGRNDKGVLGRGPSFD